MADKLIEDKKRGPISLGMHPEEGLPIFRKSGPFGPYLQLGEVTEEVEKPKKKKGQPKRHEFPVGQLPPGRYKVTVVVKDTTKWVLKDANHLLEERETWWLTVAPQS